MVTTPTAARSSLTTRLLGRAHSPSSTSRIFAEKIQHKPLLLRPTTVAQTTLDARAARRKERQARQDQRKRKPQPLTAAEKRKLHVYDIPKEEKRYELYAGLNKMWRGYMREILGIGQQEGNESRTGQIYLTPASAGPKIASADLHGADIEVVRSRCVGRVGVRGIVVRDTKFTFVVITKKNEIKGMRSGMTMSWTAKSLTQTQPFPKNIRFSKSKSPSQTCERINRKSQHMMNKRRRKPFHL